MSELASEEWIAMPGDTRRDGSEPLFDNGLWYILEAGAEKLPIACVDRGDDHHSPSRVRAEERARLIAAAPKLLRAAKAAKSELENHCTCPSGLDYLCMACERAEALSDAIAKAESQQDE